MHDIMDDHYRGISPYNVQVMQLPYNTGGKGFYGHRIFSAVPLLVDHDIVCFLDEDNWFEPEHVESLVQTITDGNLGWAHSLRNIYDKDGNFLCQDNCESLGQYPIWTDTNSHHVDTSSYAFTNEFIRHTSLAWYGGYAQDRKYFNSIRGWTKQDGSPCFDVTGKYTLNYQLGNTTTSAAPEFFTFGNAEMERKYKGQKFPWQK